MLDKKDTICPLMTAGLLSNFNQSSNEPIPWANCNPQYCMWAVPATKLIDGKWHKVGYRCGVAVGGNEVGPYEGADR